MGNGGSTASIAVARAIAYNLAGLEITAVRDSGHRPEIAGDNNIETGATQWRCELSTPISIYEEEVRSTEAAKHVASARHFLTELRKKVEWFEDFPEHGSEHPDSKDRWDV